MFDWFFPLALTLLGGLRNRVVMIDALFNQTNYVAVKKLLDATALQHEAISSNISNVEMPGYKRLDLNPSFSTQLKQAIQSQDSGQIGSLQPELMVDANAVSPGRDGNTVNLEKEMLKMNNNTLSHAVETQLITGQLLRLRLAITGRPT